MWVTTDFRPEHRAIIDWLNERTAEDTRFSGVQIEVVRISEPEFVNEFDKSVGARLVGEAVVLHYCADDVRDAGGLPS